MDTVRCTDRPKLNGSDDQVGVAEVRFRAMGSDAHVLVTGPDADDYLIAARDRIGELEARWSRFLPDSDISRVNRSAGNGQPVHVTADTVALLERAELAWSSTGGVWNPLLGHRLAALGYDRSFEAGLAMPAAELGSEPASGFDRINFDPQAGAIALPAGSGLDLGGIGKGFAADLVTEELLRSGAWGALVSLGGDLRVRGMAATGLDWGVAIGEPAIGHPHLATVRLTEGGIATSTTSRRCWPSQTNEPLHHLLDPRTSRPARSNTILTTAIAGSAWWAEVCATALTIDPNLELPSHAALQVDRSGHITQTSNFASYES